jgi:hypothetical protein
VLIDVKQQRHRAGQLAALPGQTGDQVAEDGRRRLAIGTAASMQPALLNGSFGRGMGPGGLVAEWGGVDTGVQDEMGAGLIAHDVTDKS